MEIKESVADTVFADQYCPPPKNDFPADEVGFSSNKKVFWECDQGHIFQKTPNARSTESPYSNGCPICRREKIAGNKKRR